MLTSVQYYNGVLLGFTANHFLRWRKEKCSSFLTHYVLHHHWTASELRLQDPSLIITEGSGRKFIYSYCPDP